MAFRLTPEDLDVLATIAEYRIWAFGTFRPFISGIRRPFDGGCVA
jgi:hypothetical protein